MEDFVGLRPHSLLGLLQGKAGDGRRLCWYEKKPVDEIRDGWGGNTLERHQQFPQPLHTRSD